MHGIYFIVTALGRIGHMETALEATVLSWGGQLSLGATTFWEVYLVFTFPKPFTINYIIMIIKYDMTERRYSSQWDSFMNPHDPPVNGQNGYTSMCHPWAGMLSFFFSPSLLFLISHS